MKGLVIPLDYLEQTIHLWTNHLESFLVCLYARFCPCSSQLAPSMPQYQACPAAPSSLSLLWLLLAQQKLFRHCPSAKFMCQYKLQRTQEPTQLQKFPSTNSYSSRNPEISSRIHSRIILPKICFTTQFILLYCEWWFPPLFCEVPALNQSCICIF